MKCSQCSNPIQYTKEEVYCSECGTKNYKYLESNDNSSIATKIQRRIDALFTRSEKYLYFIMDNHNGTGEIYKHSLRLDTSDITATYWSRDSNVIITIKKEALYITKHVSKKGTTGFSITTSQYSQCDISVAELMRTYPINGMNMHYTAEDIDENTKRKILRDTTGLFFKPTTKEIYDQYRGLYNSISNALEAVQPHPNQSIPKG